MSGLGFWSYFRGGLEAQGCSASYGKGQGSGRAFLLYFSGRAVWLLFLFHVLPSTGQSSCVWFPLCGQCPSTALTGRIWGCLSPSHRHGEAEKLLWFLPSLNGGVQKPSPGKRRMSFRSQTRGEEAALGCWLTAILHTFSQRGRAASLTYELWTSSHCLTLG